MKLNSIGSALVAVSLFALVGCGGAPEISNTEVTPATWKVSGINDTVTFTITTDVRNFGGTVSKVRADVQGQNLGFDLTKKESIVGGERWTVSANLTLWSGISKGTYPINITASDSTNNTATKTGAATVTVTD